MVKNFVPSFKEFLNEANYWEANNDTSKLFPLRGNKNPHTLLSGKVVGGIEVNNKIRLKDVYGESWTLNKDDYADYYYLINSDHLIFVYKFTQAYGKFKYLYFPSDYRGEDQYSIIKDNCKFFR